MERRVEGLRSITGSEFVRRLGESVHERDRHYVAWLGAGCSVSSGIPAARTLVHDHWLPRLYRLHGAVGEMEAWAAGVFPDYVPEDPARLYGPLMDQLFLFPEDRQRETERLCADRLPGFGYAVLAALMSREDGAFSTVLTTNFDDLVADAMYVFGSRRPLVVEHEALADFVRPGHVQRPLVVKVHGDHRLSPLHTAEETAHLKGEVAAGIARVLQDRGLIFIGYSGNDRGVLGALQGLPSGALPLGVWWVSRREPDGEMRDWLVSRDAVWVRADDFDKLMLLFHREFGIEHPNGRKFDRMFERYRSTFQELDRDVRALTEADADSATLKAASRRAVETAPDWWAVTLDAHQFMRSDPDRAEEIFRRGIESNEDPRLLGEFARFLSTFRRDRAGAQQVYERALTLDPANVVNLNNYGLFLSEDPTSRAESARVFDRVLTLEPDRVEALSNYAFVLDDLGERERARELFERVLALAPEHSNALGNYARHLFETCEDVRALELVERAFTAAPPDADSPLRLELWFYLAAVGPDERRAEALAQLADLVGRGVRIPGWNLVGIVERARGDGNPDAERLEQLARVLNGDEDPGVLSGWPEWPDG